MAVIVCAANATCRRSTRHLEKTLPDYARPVFLRIRKDIDMTATFKQRKVDLVKQGFDPSTIIDPLYFNDPSRAPSCRWTGPLYASIQSGQTRVRDPFS